MVDDRRDTVIVEKDRSSSPLGWIIGLAILVILLVLFFSNGGFGLFTGGNTATPAGDSVNVDMPENVNVQPAPAQ